MSERFSYTICISYFFQYWRLTYIVGIFFCMTFRVPIQVFCFFLALTATSVLTCLVNSAVYISRLQWLIYINFTKDSFLFTRIAFLIRIVLLPVNFFIGCALPLVKLALIWSWIYGFLFLCSSHAQQAIAVMMMLESRLLLCLATNLFQYFGYLLVSTFLNEWQLFLFLNNAGLLSIHSSQTYSY